MVGTASHDDDALPADVGRVFAVADGAVSWTTGLDAPVTALVGGDPLLVATGRGVRALSPGDGRIRWRRDFDARVRPWTLALADGTAVVATVDALRGVDAADGTTAWRRDGTTWSVAVAGAALYAVDWTPGTGTATLRVLDCASGERRWRLDAEAPMRTASAAHGRLYVGTADGRLLAYA